MDYYRDFGFDRSGYFEASVNAYMKLRSAMNTDATNYLVIGAGITGWSVAQYLYARNKAFRIMDTRDIPPYAAQLKNMLAKQNICFGNLKQEWMNESDVIVLSPGVSPQTPELEAASANGVEIIGDVELFARRAQKPYIAITGSNGKSTVTMLVTEILNSQGIAAKAGGNIGTPALSLLDAEDADMFVLELSSFQLETSTSLQAVAATVLNVSADHLDRHDSFEQYKRIKHSIYDNAGRKVFLRNEQKNKSNGISFGLDKPAEHHYGILQTASERWLVCGSKKMIKANELPLLGTIGELNVLAALALCQDYICDQEAALNAVRNFKGLPHRCELVVQHGDVQWVDDSKGTNIGATVAAVQSFAQSQILIVGGMHKGGSLEPLAQVVDEKVRMVIAYGRDKETFVNALQQFCEVQIAQSLDSAVQIAAKQVKSGEVVLFSPACASFDMFANYQERGKAFQQAVVRVVKEVKRVD